MATALSLMAAVPAQAASRPAVSHLTATAAPLTVLPHNSVLISGAVSPRGSGVVLLQRYVSGRWVQLSHKTTAKTGSYSFTTKTSGVLGTVIYRVTRAASASAKAAVSRTMHVHVVRTAYKVKAAARPAVASGSAIVVTGSVSPKAKGTVRLEVLQHGAWHSLGTAKLSGASTYSFSTRQPTGVYALRVRSPLTTSIASGVSPAVKVTVTAPLGAAAPSVSVSLAGTVVSAGHYTGTVTATAHLSAPAGLKSATYVLDGGGAKPYTAPVPVATAGPHKLVVTVTDAIGRTAVATSTWNTAGTVKDAVAPTVSIALSGSRNAGGDYITDVTATVTAADTGGAGLASVTYSLDNGAQTAYTAPIVVTSTGHHTLTVTATDGAGNPATATSPWTQTTTVPDTTPPAPKIDLAGTGGGNSYSGTVTVMVSATDTGSGVDSITYKLDTADPVTVPDDNASFSVPALGGHTVTLTATDLDGNTSGQVARMWTQSAVASQPLLVTSADQATLGLPAPRLVFSAYRGGPLAAARVFTLSNTTGADIAVTGLSFSGADATNFRLSAGQPTSFTVPAASSTTVSVEFHPTDPTGCPTSAQPLAIGNVNRVANLVLTTTAAGETTATADLSGVNACYLGGNDEPVLQQVLNGLGYTDKVHLAAYDERYIGQSRYISGTDEIISPYFASADGGPVTVTPIAHYGTANTMASGYQSTGWYVKGAAMDSAKSTCNSSCNTLWKFPADFNTVGDSTTYNQNQLLLPTPTGTTSFTPTTPFGLFSGDFTDVNYSDDSLNVGHQNSGTGHTADANLPVPHYLHDLRVYPAYGPGHVLIPNTYIVGDDLSRVPAYKNNDYQDVVLLVSNVTPALSQGRTSNQTINLTSGVTVNGSCAGTFDGVLGTCDTSKIHTTASGLQLTSSGTGQLATDDQVNGLYRTFDASRGAFTVSARVIGSTDQLQNNYQQIGAFFGPDQDHFIKIEAEHNGSPGLTLFWNDGHGSGTSAASVSPAGLTTASTLDLVIKGNTNVPDPLPYGDPYGVSGFPLDQLTVWYSIDGGTLTQIGSTVEMPKDVTGWFSRQAKAGILVASPGAGVPITATFSQFSIVNN